MNFSDRRDQARCLREIPLESVLSLWDAKLDRCDKHKWHTSQGVISVNGAKFMNWTHGQGGGGAIDLVMHLGKLNFKEAVDWLGQCYSGRGSPSPASATPEPQLQFELPPPEADNLNHVKRYLIVTRRIPPYLVDCLITHGTLYADRRGNAVFLLLGKQSTPIGAELRGTTDRAWRGMAPGSRKDFGFFSIPADGSIQPSAPVILCESAIDAISCFALHPGHLCISTAGVRSNPPWLKDLLTRHYAIYCGFDSDPAGDDTALAMVTLHPKVKRLRPSLHDWNDVLKEKGKV